MTQLNITLSDELDTFVEQSLRSGCFHNASELVSTALHYLKAQDDAKFAALRDDIAAGLAQLDRGESAESDAESIRAEGRARLLADQRR